MTGAWVKLFEDGSREFGTDRQISMGEASWTRGRLTNIKEVQLLDTIILASLSIPSTSWHQFDHFIVKVDFDKPMPPTKIYSIVQAEIKEHHVGLFINNLSYGPYVYYINVHNRREASSILISETMVGKWITLVLPKRGQPYVNISERGKFDGDI